MRRNGGARRGSNNMSPLPSPSGSIASGETEVVLEGSMLKQSRNKLWQERYFVFSSKQVLSYYHRKGEARPKASYLITREAGCKVSDLYVEQRQKGSVRELLYCVTVSFSDDMSVSTYNRLMTENSLRENSLREDSSFHGGNQFNEPSPPSTARSSKAALKRSRSHSPCLRRMESPIRSGRGSLERHSAHDDLDDSGEKTGMLTPIRARLWFRRESSGRRDSGGRDSGGRDNSGRENSGRDNGPILFPNIDGESVGSAKKNKSIFPNRRNLLLRRHSDRSPQIPSYVNLEVLEEPTYETILESSATSSSRDLSNKIKVQQEINMNSNPVGHAEHFDRIQENKGFRSPHSNNAGADSKNRGVQLMYGEQHAAEENELRTRYLTTMKENKRKDRKRVVEGTKIAAAAGAAIGVGVLTAGVGIAAGLVFLGATAAVGGTAAGAEHVLKKSGNLTFASTSFEEAKLWKSSLDACLEFESVKQSTWGQLFIADGRKKASALLSHDVELMTVRSREGGISPNSDDRPKRTFELPAGQSNLFLKNKSILIEASTKWQPLEGGWNSLLGAGAQGLRIFREEKAMTKADTRKITMLGVGGSTCCPPLKSTVVLPANALDAFMCLMSYARIPSGASDEILSPQSGQRASFRSIEKIDDHMDVVHLVCRELYLFPSWTMPRDFVLFRYWRYEPDGSYIVCYESVEHPACPPYPGYIRGEMHQVCTLAPTKKYERRRSGISPECLLTTVVQVDPKGWVPNRPLPFLSNQGYSDAFGVAALLQLLDIRDAIDFDRFLDVAEDPPVHRHPSRYRRKSLGNHLHHSSRDLNNFPNYDFEFSNRERHDSLTFDKPSGIESKPPPLAAHKWAEPDANSFLVRGPHYKTDKVKINAGTSIGQLIAVDVVRVDKPLYGGMSMHPKERIQQALARERKLLAKGDESEMPAFIFVVNIILPGPPVYHGVFYYAVNDMSTIDGSDGTGSSMLCKQFLFGKSDDFRDRTFKLIPQIVQGNFLVRQAVGSTPAIMGTKLKQTYVRDERFMEVILDCGSSPVATGVIRLCLGYAKTLAIDMGFLLEADHESTLPERIFGCVRMKFPDFGPHLRKVDPPESFQEQQ